MHAVKRMEFIPTLLSLYKGRDAHTRNTPRQRRKMIIVARFSNGGPSLNDAAMRRQLFAVHLPILGPRF